MIAYNELMIKEPPFPHGRDCCLFLHVDGALLEIAPTPDAVQVDESLRSLLRVLERACNGALALISGRTICDIDDLFEPLFMPVSGVHGCERRDGQGYWRLQTLRSAEFADYCDQLFPAVAPLEGILVEDKGCGVALHYRQARQSTALLRQVLEGLTTSLPDTHGAFEGDAVIEVRPHTIDSRSAVRSFLKEPPFQGRVPIVIGGDLTEQDEFLEIRKSGGLAMAVGANTRSEWQLPDPKAVRRWLTSFIDGIA